MSSKPGKNTQRQHFIPCLLLKGFAHRTKGREYYVYEFRRGSQPHEVNITNVGVEKNFYGRGEESDVEQKLSRKETEYASLVRNLWLGRIDPGQKPLIDDLVTHLIVRTKHLRKGFSDLGTALLDSFEHVLEEPQNRAELKRKIVEEMLENNRLKPILRRVAKGRRRAFLSKVFAATGIEPVSVFQKMLQLAQKYIDVEEAARSAQLKALGTDDALARRRQALRPLVWSIVTYPQGTLLLGDLGPVARFAESDDLQAPIKFTTTPEAICLPVSSQHLLIGQRHGTNEGVGPETVNVASVELSRDLFVASQSTERELNYLAQLGRRSAFLEESEMEVAFRRVLE